MKNRFTKWVSALGAVAMVAGVLAITNASAHIGVSHQPIETDAPDLLTADIDGDDVLACYDEDLDEDELDTPEDFALRGYNDAIIEDGDDVEQDDDDGNCARVTFDDQDLANENFTIFHSVEGAVEDDAGDSSVEAAAELGGSAPDTGAGHTTAPNLTAFSEDDPDNTIEYTFAGDVDCDIITSTTDADNFGFYDNDGDASFGDTIDDCSDNEVTVVMDGDVNDAERVFIENDEVDDDSSGDGTDGGGGDICTEETEDGDQDCAGFEHEGSRVADPDLSDAERVGADEWEGTFDEELETDDVDEALVQLAAEDGELFEADAGTCETREGDEVIRCEWTDLEDTDDDEIVAMHVEAGAVQADDNGDDSTVGDAPLSATAEPGFTDGPDLETLDIDEGSNEATFGFGDPVDEDTVDETEFSLVDEQGNLASGDDVIDVVDNEVTIEFDEEDVEEAVGGHVEHNSIEDFIGNLNTGTVVGEFVPAPSPTSPGPTTPPPTSPPPPPPTVREPSTITIRHRNRPHRFRGRVGSARRRCRSGRRVVVKKVRRGPDRVVARDTTNRRGRWAKRHNKGGRGRYYAIARRKAFSTPNANVICQRARSRTIRARR